MLSLPHCHDHRYSQIDSLYAACLPESGLVSYGNCRDEALNNLAEELRLLAAPEEGRSHASRH